MALTRCQPSPGCLIEWEVDGSGITVQRLEGEAYWQVSTRVGINFRGMLHSYLQEHGLNTCRASSRAAAVEAVRFTLERTPPYHSPDHPVRTRWVKQEDGQYLSGTGTGGCSAFPTGMSCNRSPGRGWSCACPLLPW